MKRRAATTLVLLGLLVAWNAGLGALMRQATRQAQLESTQETLRAALIAYYEDREAYPPLNRANAGDLAQFLVYAGYLDTLPANPATGQPFTGEKSEPHRLWYVAEEDFSGWRWEAQR